ncbi:hypothetical protein ACWDR0_13595 [Streptomyces sp. NPDC003691]
MNIDELRGQAAELRFTPQKPVRWLAPRELARTGVKVALAAVFAGYSDKREIQGALEAGLLRAPLADPGAEELWFDFVADLGDGFESTYTVATALAAAELPVAGPGGATETGGTLPRGSLLVLGGDQVYPVASTTAYEDRMKGPYRAALPSAPDQPLMVALPGNHDWYDGLTAFLRIFVQGQRIGGWETRQTRSYFAVKLPRRWWLVGLDSQLGSYIDDPQRRYFETHLSPLLEPGDSVIVCYAAPTWVKSAEDPDAFNSLHWFDRNIVRTSYDRKTGTRSETGASIRLWLTGDKHHYARYEERLPGDPPGSGGGLPPDPLRRQLVTCGLGGAYLASTHELPAALALPPAGSRMREKDSPPDDFALARTYPAAAESRSLARAIARPWSRHWLPRRNPGFAALAATLQAVLVLLVSGVFALAEGRRNPADALRGADSGDLSGLLIASAGLFALTALLGPAGRAAPPGRAKKLLVPSVPAVCQLALAVGTLAAAVALAGAVPPSWKGFALLAMLLAVGAVSGALPGSQFFAWWVLWTRTGAVADWQMSGQSVDDRTGFLRMHIAPDGTLTLRALVIDRTCRDWSVEEVPDTPAPWLRPVPAVRPAVQLAEEPIVIAPTPGSGS